MSAIAPHFRPGDRVRVRAAHPPGHVRTPWFCRGKVGRVAELAGTYENPEELAYGRPGTPEQPLYRVQFAQRDLWPGYEGSAKDSTVIDLYQHWLEPAGDA